jgi:hypothetical protein
MKTAKYEVKPYIGCLLLCNRSYKDQFTRGKAYICLKVYEMHVTVIDDRGELNGWDNCNFKVITTTAAKLLYGNKNTTD